MCIFLFIIFLSNFLFGQKAYTTVFIDAFPEIDGIPNEECWSELSIASDFIVKYPTFGEESEAQTKVKLFYSVDAIYISAELHDKDPEKVNFALSQRDDKGNADWFAFTIDPWGNKTNAFQFIVTAAGVELDALLGINKKDFSWNAVWKSATTKTDYGWSLEMMIPFSAIRFPNKNTQNWNINFSRQVRRKREESFWSPVDPEKLGEITQTGKLIGVNDIKSPLRLSFTPFLTSYVEKNGNQKWKPRFTGGMDVKYGINDAFTLDVSLIPDFGQTVSDKKVLNLTPFEVQFNENRPFFLEGTELFKIGNLFYSRRVGAKAFSFNSALNKVNQDKKAEVISIQNQAQLINATKISGRTKKGLGIGFFNAIEQSSNLIYRDSNGIEKKVRSHPLSNYNVFVLSQNMSNNGQISFVNTNVVRSGHARDANVTGVVADLYSKDGKYNIDASLKVSSIFEDKSVNFGHTLSVGLSKVGGTFRYKAGYSEISSTYNPNDLGFLSNNNSRSFNGSVEWRSFDFSGKLVGRALNIYANYNQLYRPNLFSSLKIGMSAGGTFENFLSAGFGVSIKPLGSVNHFESRFWGKEVRYTQSISTSIYFSSDYSKKFAWDLRGWYQEFFVKNQRAGNLLFSPRFRFSDRFLMVWSSQLTNYFNDYGYVLGQNISDKVVIGTRNRLIIENSLQAELIFTKRMGINLKLRHYWQQVQYTSFSELLNKGKLESTEYGDFDGNGYSSSNTHYDAFTIDVGFRWVFMTGSELKLVYKNNIFQNISGGVSTYFSTFKGLFNQEQLNSISLKVLFYIDSRYFKSKKKTKA